LDAFAENQPGDHRDQHRHDGARAKRSWSGGAA
jgi:hypothetical protein